MHEFGLRSKEEPFKYYIIHNTTCLNQRFGTRERIIVIFTFDVLPTAFGSWLNRFDALGREPTLFRADTEAGIARGQSAFGGCPRGIRGRTDRSAHSGACKTMLVL
jgi:hypothetical protein